MREPTRFELHYRVPSMDAFDTVLGHLWPDRMFVNFDGINARLETAEIEAVVRISKALDVGGERSDLELRMPKNRIVLSNVHRVHTGGRTCVETSGCERKKGKVARAINDLWSNSTFITANEELTLRYYLRDGSGAKRRLTIRPAISFLIDPESKQIARAATYGFTLGASEDDGIQRYRDSEFFKALVRASLCVPANLDLAGTQSGVAENIAQEFSCEVVESLVRKTCKLIDCTDRH